VTTEKPSLGFPPMQTTSLVPAGTSFAQTGGPPLVLDNVSNADLRALCQEMYNDRGFLAGVIPERFGPIVSTGATGIAAGIAGLVDGGLGPNSNKIGPIPINTAAAVVFAARRWRSSTPRSTSTWPAAQLAAGLAFLDVREDE
jgi:hypothetical protein